MGCFVSKGMDTEETEAPVKPIEVPPQQVEVAEAPVAAAPAATTSYRFNRGDGQGPVIRTRTSIERHISTAPSVRVGYNGPDYPHKYNNLEKIFPPGGSYYEYVANEFPYSDQTGKGKIRKPNSEERYKPAQQKQLVGAVRTISDRHKNVHGVVFHPDPQAVLANAQAQAQADAAGCGGVPGQTVGMPKVHKNIFYRADSILVGGEVRTHSIPRH